MNDSAKLFFFLQLVLDGNNLGDTGAVELAKALAVDSTLTRVCCT